MRSCRSPGRAPPSHTDEGLQCALRARRERPGLPVLVLVLVLSQHMEQLYARELLADVTGGIGYLLKDRVFDADQFIDAVRRVAAGGTARDPQVIPQLLSRRAAGDQPLGRLTPREREVLELMAQGRSNTAIAERLVVTERAIAKGCRSNQGSKVHEQAVSSAQQASDVGRPLKGSAPIAKHTSNIFAKLGLEVSDDDSRRVLAVLAYLDRDRWTRFSDC